MLAFTLNYLVLDRYKYDWWIFDEVQIIIEKKCKPSGTKKALNCTEDDWWLNVLLQHC